MEDYEKKYKEALSRAATELETCGADKSLRNMIYAIFPDELKESEDEKIRKALVDALNKNLGNGIEKYGTTLNAALTWLEKQGSQQPTIIWHSVGEEPEEMKELFCEWESDDATWHDVAFYDEESKTFRHAKMPINVTKWVYVDELLEKQGEQKPVLDFKASNWYVSKVDGKIHDMTYNSTDKVEPKFKIGDYIVSDYCMGRVVEITNDAYLLDTGQGIPFSCEDNVHLWTIADAKEGNILAGKIDGDNYIFIFKTIKDGWIETYGHYYNAVNRFCVPSQLFCRSYQGTFTPATKEQRDTLMKAMANAGYEWDDEKKELKKLTQSVTKISDKVWSEEDEKIRNALIKGVECCKASGWTNFGNNVDIDVVLAWLEKQGEQKPIDYNKELKKCRENPLYFVDKYVKLEEKPQGKTALEAIKEEKVDNANKVESKFKVGDVLCDKSCTTLDKNSQPNIEILDIRDGMYICNNCSFPISQQDEYELVTKRIEPQSAWSDEDEAYINNAIAACRSLYGEYSETAHWLKSLKDRLSWKPSEEQMQVFEAVYDWYNNNFAPSETLTSLYNGLKKL